MKMQHKELRKGFLITYPQLETFAKKELESFDIADSEIIDDGLILFKTTPFKLEQYAYYCQSGFYVGYFLGTFNEFQNFEVISKLKKKEKNHFKVEVVHPRNVKINDIERKNLIMCVVEKTKDYFVLNPKKDNLLLIYKTKTNTYFGVSVFDKDLSKRSYKIYQTSKSLKGPLGFLMNIIADAFNKKNVLHIFVGDGVTAIEYALHKSSISPRYFDKRILHQGFISLSNSKIEDLEIKQEEKLNKITIATDTDQKNLTFAERNAQLANVLDAIKFMRLEIDWFDYKFKENQFDAIIGFPPLFNTSYTQKKVKNFFEELFYQIEFILKPQQYFVMLSKVSNYEIISKIAEKWKFKIERIAFDFREDVEILKMQKIKN